MSGIIRGYHEELGAVDILVDEYTRGVCALGVEHEKIHEGEHFQLSHYFSDVDTDGYGRIRFKTPTDKYIHAVFFAGATAGVLFTIYREPGFTHNAGNAITSFNRNDSKRVSHPDVLQEACHTPSGSGAGTVFVPTFPHGAGGNPAKSGPGGGRGENEVDLDVDTVYLIEAQSLSDNNHVTIGVDFYHTPA